MPLAGKNSLVFLSATGITFATAATTAADGKTYQVAATSFQGEPFDPLASVTVQTSSGGTVSTTGYTLYRPNGTVVFPTSSTNAYTISGTYLPTAVIANAHGFTYQVTADVADVTVLGSAWRSKIQTLLDVSGSVDDFHLSSTYATLVASSSQPVAMTFFQASTVSFDARVYGYLTADSLKSSVDGIVDGSVSFEGSADLNGRTVTFTTRGTSG
jgi:hypothetical protein